MRGRSWRLGRMVVAVAFVAVAAALVGTFTATRERVSRAVRLHQGRSRQLDQDQGRNCERGARRLARRAAGGPAGLSGGRRPGCRDRQLDRRPSLSSRSTARDRAPGNRSARARPSTRPCSISSSPAARSTRPPAASPRSRSAAASRTASAPSTSVRPAAASGRRQGDRRNGQRELAVQVRLVRDERDRLAARRSERPDRQHASTRAPASRTPPATRRPAWASTSRPTAATRGRSFPAATSSRTARSRRWRSTEQATCSSAIASAIRGVSSVTGGAIGCPTHPLCRPRCLPPDRRRRSR